MNYIERLIPMRLASLKAIGRITARAEALLASATGAGRPESRKRVAEVRAGRSFGWRCFRHGWIALPILICRFAPQCAAAEAAPLPQPAATATNVAEADADVAWKKLQKALRPPTPPESWRTNSPTLEERNAFNKRNGELAAQVADLAGEFYTRFPDHPKAPEARQRELEMRKTAVQLGNASQIARLNELEGARAKDPQTQPEDAFLLRWRSIERQAAASGPAGSPAFLDAVQKGVFALRKEFPERLEVYELMLQLLEIRSQEGEADKARALAQVLIESSIREEAKEGVRRLIRKFDFLGKPFQLKFTAVDGREVDLAKMRGKVVLIDFWASWCGPCLAEIPRIKAAYGKLQAKGFEIIGINLDEDKADMQRVLTSAKITWPQCFDGQKWEGPLATRFGIMGIPALWLVDKRGVLRELSGEPNLVEKVERLLEEKTDSL